MIADNGSLRTSLVISTGLHVGMLLFLYFGLPHIFKPLPAPHQIIPIDIVEIGAITNTRVGKNEEETKPPASQAIKPLPPTENKPPEPAKPPEPPKPEVKPAEQKPAEVEALSKAAVPKEKPAPPAPPKPEAPQQNQLSSVLKNVAKLKPQVSENKADTTKPGKTTIVNGGQGGFGPALSDRLTISEEDALRRQIQQCWNVPAGARDADKLVVEVLINVNPDRTVRDVQVVDQGRLSDPFFRAAAESALRALRNPKCSPLELPPDQYEQWKTITFTFDPRDML